MITKNAHKKLTAEERDQLAIWKAKEKSNGECARLLKRSVSTIGRELKRNKVHEKHYVAICAQQKAQERQWRSAHSKEQLKNADVHSYVTARLRDGWSPDQIAGRLRRDHRGDKHWYITAETIYRWIYHPQQMKCKQPWYEYLRRKQKKRKKQIGRKVHRSHIPDRVSISQRPEEINQRTQFGHWEGVSVEGIRHNDEIHTEVERMSRLIAGKKIDAITGEATITAQKRIFA